MKKYIFRVTQDMKGYYKGEITVEAKSKKEAKSIIKNMSQEELEDAAEDWIMGDDCFADGEVEIGELKYIDDEPC